jgi:hypothetical protein
MPEFETQTPPERQNRPLRRHIVSISGRILLFVVVAISVGLLSYSYSVGLYIYSYEPYTDPQERTVVCDGKSFIAPGWTCIDPYYKTVSEVVCEVDSLTGYADKRTCEPLSE